MNIKINYSPDILRFSPNNLLQSISPLNNKIVAVALVAFACLAACCAYIFLYRAESKKISPSNSQGASGTEVDAEIQLEDDTAVQKHQTNTAAESNGSGPSTQTSAQTLVAELNTGKPISCSVDNLLTSAKSHGGSIKHLNLSDIELTNEQLIELASHCTHLTSLTIRSSVVDRQTLSKLNLNGLESLDLSHCTHLTDADLVLLEGLTKLKVLRLAYCPKLTRAVYHVFRNLTDLHELDLAGCKGLGHRDMNDLLQFDSYKTLLLTGSHDNLSNDRIPQIPSLVTINLEDCHWVDGFVMRELIKLPQLKNLNLSGCQNFNENDLEDFKTCSLERFELRGCKQLAYKHLIAIGKMHSLQQLDLSDCNLPDLYLDPLEALVHLRFLRLRGNETLTGQFLAKLHNVNQLTILDVSNCYNIQQYSKDHLSRLPMNYTQHDFFQRLSDHRKLRVLNLSGYHKMTDEFLEYFSGLVDLEILNLDRCSNVTDAGIAKLKALVALKELRLSGTRITNNGLAHISGLSNLEHLVVQDCTSIDNKGLKHLTPLSKLRSLNVMGCPSITPAGTAQLKNTVEIIRY